MKHDIPALLKGMKRFLADSTRSLGEEPKKRWLISKTEEESLKVVIDMLNDCI